MTLCTTQSAQYPGLYLYYVVCVCLATEYTNSAHLICDHNGSENNYLIQLVLDVHNGSFGSLATE